MENEGMLTPREAWERRQNGEDVATGSRAGYETARGKLLHNSTLLLGEKCLVRNDISGWNDNPWWVRVTMTDGVQNNVCPAISGAASGNEKPD